MNLESLLNRFTHNVESIIQWLFLFILALSGFLISRWLLFKKSDGGETATASASGPSPEISGVLQQILERTAKLDGANVQPLSPEQVALASTQVESLKKELSAREDELKALKAAGSGTTEETSKLASRLKELEAKLAEYEILEDDIADLSLYKEENVRLRAELDKLKNGGAAAAPGLDVQVNEADVAAAIAAAAGGEAPAPPAPVAAAPEPAAPVSPDADIVAEFAQAVGAESAPLPEVTMQVPDTGNPMKDFEAAVQIEQQLKAKAPAAAAAAPAASASAATAPATAAASPAPTAPAPAAASAQAEADDLFAEFTESPKADEPAAEGGALDTDKMMAEMAALVGMEPATGSSLEEGIDIDKMAAEAAKR